MTIYLNGEYMPLAEAKISVLDRGFIFGDGVYEVIPVYSRQAFRLQAHLLRLQHSLDGIQLINPRSIADWTNIVAELIRQNSNEDQSIYLHVTRGVAPRDFPFPDVLPTVFAMSNPLSMPDQALISNGVSAITAEDNRWLRCDIKTISLLPNVLLRQKAVQAGCAETVMIRPATTNNAAFLTEGSASNIFMVKNDILFTPPKDHLMLPGITYDVILEIARDNGIPYEVRKIIQAELYTADELMLTSSTREVQAITRLDGKPIGDAFPGPVFKKINQLYQEFKREVMRTL